MFDFNVSRVQPQLCEKAQRSMATFVTFLKEVQTLGLLEGKREGKIVYADDQFVNKYQLTMQFKDLGLEERLIVLDNGEEVVEYFDEQLK